MQTTQADLDFALKMYGEATLDYAENGGKDAYDNMAFWQDQVWQCAKAIAKGE